jgi:fucose permease
MNLGFIILAYTALVALSFFDNGRGAAYPEILSHFKISTDMGSYLFSLVSLSGLLVNLTGRFWMPITGLVGGTRFSMVLIGLGSFGVSYGASQNSYYITLAFATLAGLGLGALAITMNIMVSEGAPIHQRRRYLSGLHGVYGVSSFLAPQAINLLIFYGENWITYFKYISIVTILVLIYSFWVTDTHKEHVQSSTKKFPISIDKRVIIGLFMGLYVASEIVVSSRLSLYLTRVENFDSIKANSYLSYFFISLMTGRLLFAFIDFKHDNKFLLILSFMATLVCFTVGVFVHPIALPLCGFTMSYTFPVSMDWLNEKFKQYNHLMVASVMTTIGIALSTMHWGFGQITDIYGVKTAFYCFYILNIGSLILFLISDKISLES